MRGDSSVARGRSAYIGWWAAGFTLIAIFAGAAVLWFMFHPW